MKLRIYLCLVGIAVAQILLLSGCRDEMSHASHLAIGHASQVETELLSIRDSLATYAQAHQGSLPDSLSDIGIQPKFDLCYLGKGNHYKEGKPVLVVYSVYSSDYEWTNAVQVIWSDGLVEDLVVSDLLHKYLGSGISRDH